ncbi:MAG TPA: FmdB family zinc ribbon protein [Candidatus Limnocylindria bacterium]
MPTYDYQCRSCGSVTEVIHSMLAEGPTVCEQCGGPLRRMIYPTGIIFKGSGFYRTDSRNGGDSSSSSGSDSQAKPASKTASSSTEASGGSSTGADTSKGAEPSKGTGTSKSADSPKD